MRIRTTLRAGRGGATSIAAAWLLAACASAGTSGSAGRPPPAAIAPVPARAAGAPAECPPEPARAGRPAELRVAAPGPIAPTDVPSPRSAAERIAFRQMYATLVRVDCSGHLRPGLAGSWSLGEDGRRWTFHLRETDRFWDGTRVTAGDVAWSWRRLSESRRASRPVGGSTFTGPTLLELPPALPDSVAAIDDATLEAYFSGVAPPAAAFADPRLAVLRADAGRWPLGSGPFRPAASSADDFGTDSGIASGIDSAELVLRSANGPRSTLVLVRGAPGSAADERDLLDAGVDVVVTSDPRTRRYAGSLADYVALPEPWSRTYALAVPGAPGWTVESAPPGDGLDSLRASLARDAVRAEAAPATPLGWRAASTCAPTPTAGPRERAVPPARIPRLAYALGDGPARDLADRLVALASAPPGGDPEAAATAALLRASPGLDWRTLPLVAEVLGASARAAGEAAYVVVLPRRVLDPCAARRSLETALPWLARGGELTPLVDTRPSVLVRRDVSGLAVDFDGTPRLDLAGRPAGGGGSP